MAGDRFELGNIKLGPKLQCNERDQQKYQRSSGRSDAITSLSSVTDSVNWLPFSDSGWEIAAGALDDHCSLDEVYSGDFAD